MLLAGATGRIGSSFAKHVLAHGGRIAAAARRPWQVEALQASLGRDQTLVGLVPTGDSGAHRACHRAVAELNRLEAAHV